MKTVNSIFNLFDIYKELDEPWCFFVEIGFVNEINSIKQANYYLSETSDEFDDMDDTPDKYKPWLEYQTFQAIIENRLEHHPDSSKDELLEAVIYYLKEDDFID